MKTSRSIIRLCVLSSAVAIPAMAPSAASAAILVYTAQMNGPNESPPNNSPGIGTATVTVDTTANTMRVQATFSGLTGTTTMAHIHGLTPTPLTGTAGVITTTPNFVGFPVGVTAGSMDQTYDLTLASTYNAAFVTAQGSIASARTQLLLGLDTGRTYFNVHTSTFSGGEIRGFLVPAPGAAALLAALGAWTARRRR